MFNFAYLIAKLTPTVELNALAMKRGEAAMYTFIETPRPANPYAYNMPPNIRAVYNQVRETHLIK